MSYFAKKKRKKKAKGKGKKKPTPRTKSRKGKVSRPKPKPRGKATPKRRDPVPAEKQRLSDSALVKLYGSEEKESEEKEPELKCKKKYISGKLTLNSLEEIEAYLRQIGSSVRLVVCISPHPCDLLKKASRRTLFFVPIDSVSIGLCQKIDCQMDASPNVTGFLVSTRGVQAFAPYSLSHAWFRRFVEVTKDSDSVDFEECVVCCEELCDESRGRHVEPCRWSLACNMCGVAICFKCVVAIATANPKLMGGHSHAPRKALFQCPLCRFDHNSFDVYSVCAGIVMCGLLQEVSDDKLRRKVMQNAMESEQFKDANAMSAHFCSQCKRRLDLMKRRDRVKLTCAKCKRVNYCSALCRVKQQKHHQKFCPLWSLSRASPFTC